MYSNRTAKENLTVVGMQLDPHSQFVQPLGSKKGYYKAQVFFYWTTWPTHKITKWCVFLTLPQEYDKFQFLTRNIMNLTGFSI